MALCLMAPSHSLNQFFLTNVFDINGILWHHRKAISQVLMNVIHNMCTYIRLLKLLPHLPGPNEFTHWGCVMHICLGNLTIVGWDNGLSPGRRQAIIWTNAIILLIWSLGTNFSDISIEILTFSFEKKHLKMSSEKWRPFSLGLNELKTGCQQLQSGN